MRDYELVDNIKDQLIPAYLNTSYNTSLFKNEKFINAFKVTVKNLPPELKYNEIQGILSGNPKISGEFSLEIFNSTGNLIKLVKLRVETCKKIGNAFV